MTHTSLYVLAIGIGFFYALKYANNAKKDVARYEPSQKQMEQNPYSDMRNMAFSVSSENLGLSGIGKDEIYGIISEMDMDGATATVVTFATGDTSLYLSTGAGFIGAGQHESVQKVVKKYVKSGQQYFEKATKNKKAELPKDGMTNFNFLTEDGIYTISKSLKELESGKSEFSNLFMELNEVISQIRLKIGSKNTH